MTRDLPNLTPAQARQLEALHMGRHRSVHLGLVRALVRKGLVRERYGRELEEECRMPSCYPLTSLGVHALTTLPKEARS